MDGQRLHDVGMDALTVVEVALVEAAQQHLGGGDVGGDRHTVHIAQPQKVLLAAAAALGLERVGKKSTRSTSSQATRAEICWMPPSFPER